MSLNGLSTINIELTSICNFSCEMCGRRKIEREYPEIARSYGHMDFELLKKIEPQIPPGTLVQFHNNGDPLEYPRLGEALKLFEGRIRCFNTKGGNQLNLKKEDIVGNLEVLTISVIQKENGKEDIINYLSLLEFITSLPKDEKPRVVLRMLGNISDKRMDMYKKMNIPIVKRILHSPMGSFDYEKKITRPEYDICLDMLTHPAIDRHGNVSICVRFDPDGIGRLGSLNDKTLEEIWNGDKRKEWLKKHIDGNRNDVPLCSKCHYYGVPRG